MLEPGWRRIAGIHAQDDGTIGAVWIAHDTTSDTTHLYDAAIFRREVLAVIAEGLTARGRWIPVAWQKDATEFADKLLDRGVNMLPEYCGDSQGTAEVISREVWQRMRTSRFRVERRVGEWLDEYKTFYRDEAKVPLEGFPLMSATRHALEMLAYAMPQQRSGPSGPRYPDVKVI